jgi:hypothetical protein
MEIYMNNDFVLIDLVKQHRQTSKGAAQPIAIRVYTYFSSIQFNFAII